MPHDKRRDYLENVVLAGATVGVNAVAYATGDLLGSKLTLARATSQGGFSSVLERIIVRDLSDQSAPIDLILFDADPTGTTFTNNSPLDVADADLPKIIGTKSIVAADYAAFADNAVAYVEADIAVRPASGTTLYAALVIRGAATYVANELSIELAFRRP